MLAGAGLLSQCLTISPFSGCYPTTFDLLSGLPRPGQSQLPRLALVMDPRPRVH